ncbi:MAG: hypothetical protein HY298_12345 [Verrucomicrobia bacterium]|nr:hypothetical protein [Verrucomicrobiota bacterium]
MLDSIACHTRREFIQRLGSLGIACSAAPLLAGRVLADDTAALPDPALKFPGPWQFQMHRGGIILVSDQQLEDLQDPDKVVDLSLSQTPNPTTLRKICEQTKAAGGRTVILAFDEFWTQYRAGQGNKPRALMPDTDDYIRRLARIGETLKAYGLGFELSLLSPLEIGRGYQRKTGESGRCVQYREGYRDPATGKYTVSLWEEHRWTNNKGSIELKRTGVRVFAFREQRVGGTSFYAVSPADIVELKSAPDIDVDESAVTNAKSRRMMVRGSGETQVGTLNRVLVVVSYTVPEMDYFSPKALPFLEDLVNRYHAAGVPLNGLYADEMHIQQDWHYASHHDEGQLTFRYLTPHMAQTFAKLYGAEFADFEKFLVYFAYGQHGFLPDLEARLPAQHVFGHSPEEVQKSFLLRRRYFDLLQRSVVELFVKAKEFAEKKYGQELEARAHATWAQSPTIDFWNTGNLRRAPRQYEYTPDFLWSNTVQQAACACDDYFEWNEFLTGGGNDHAEGGWSDRDYYGIALACSTGILNRVPQAYAAAWGMPGEVGRRHQALCDAYGASASEWFAAVQDIQHRDTDVLMLYPLSLVACEERFGSWMVQYGYANYVTPRKLLERGRVNEDGKIEMAGRKFGTLAVLFEPLPPVELLPFMEKFVEVGGKLVWSGPPPRLDLSGQSILARWQTLVGVKNVAFGVEGQEMPGRQIHFTGVLKSVLPQTVLTDFLVDLVYPVEPDAGVEIVANLNKEIVGVHRATAKGGSATFLGFRPRDDQAASLGEEVRTWFEILFALGAYPKTQANAPANDNPSVVSRTTPYLACSFPNGTTSIAVHYRTHEESWPGGFHRDAKQDAEILARNPLPPDRLELRDFAVNGHRVNYDGLLTVAFRLDDRGALIGFAGHNCRRIVVDGHEHNFASQPMALMAWAPVLPARRVPGGAVLELWVKGDAEVSVPLSAGVTKGRLFFRGARPGSLGEAVESVCENGGLRFKAQGAWGQRHLLFVAG